LFLFKNVSATWWWESLFLKEGLRIQRPIILYLLFVFYINGKPKKKKLEHEGGGCGREKN
jgi:hypothetical protein